MLLRQLERLAEAGIQPIPMGQISSHFFLERDGFVALVERKGEGFGNFGAPGLMTEHGFAVLVWREGLGYFVARGFEQQATPEQVDGLRRFASDLESALKG